MAAKDDKPTNEPSDRSAQPATPSGMAPGGVPLHTRAADDPVTETGQDAQPATDPAPPVQTEIADAFGTAETPQYQLAGQARQLANELYLLEQYGSGDSDRADKLRRTLREMGHPEAAECAPDPTGAPAGRSSRDDRTLHTEATSETSVKPTIASGSGLSSTAKPKPAPDKT